MRHWQKSDVRIDYVVSQTDRKWILLSSLRFFLIKMIRPRQKKLGYNKFSIQIKNASIERKESTKFLGVIVDEHLGWKDHVSAVASKITKSIGIISKSRYYLSQKSLFMLYYSLIYPYLYYGNIIWGSTYHTNLYRLRILQKCIVRIITSSNYDAHTLPLLHQ